LSTLFDEPEDHRGPVDRAREKWDDLQKARDAAGYRPTWWYLLPQISRDILTEEEVREGEEW
jgi:hypothetical protein